MSKVFLSKVVFLLLVKESTNSRRLVRDNSAYCPGGVTRKTGRDFFDFMILNWRINMVFLDYEKTFENCLSTQTYPSKRSSDTSKCCVSLALGDHPFLSAYYLSSGCFQQKREQETTERS